MKKRSTETRVVMLLDPCQIRASLRVIDLEKSRTIVKKTFLRSRPANSDQSIAQVAAVQTVRQLLTEITRVGHVVDRIDWVIGDDWAESYHHVVEHASVTAFPITQSLKRKMLEQVITMAKAQFADDLVLVESYRLVEAVNGFNAEPVTLQQIARTYSLEVTLYGLPASLVREIISISERIHAEMSMCTFSFWMQQQELFQEMRPEVVVSITSNQTEVLAFKDQSLVSHYGIRAGSNDANNQIMSHFRYPQNGNTQILSGLALDQKMSKEYISYLMQSSWGKQLQHSLLQTAHHTSPKQVILSAEKPEYYLLLLQELCSRVWSSQAIKITTLKTADMV